ncbi:MAG: ABC transporter ATP-binding protein [Bradyrhizobiaceae bacterium]|nr:ABC transporter ATP-binding protein [Bradyrhizobiaceae bacterium]
MTTVLQVESLTRVYGGLRAVAELSFTVTKGEILGLIGPNGAGKTTVVNLVSGVVKPNSGRITFDNADVTGMAPHLLARRGLVRTFQSTLLYGNCTVRENAMRGAYLTLFPGFVAAFFDTARAKHKREAAEALVTELLDWLELTPFGDLIAASMPYGYQKILGIVIALAARPSLILLDEPVAGLSARETDQIRDTIKRVRERGITVVVIDHNMRFITGLCDRVVVIAHGQELAQGAPHEVMRNPAVIEAYLGKSHAAARTV